MIATLLGILLLIIGAIGLFALIIGLSSILNGWALSILWGWFMVPVFHLPVLSLPAAIGIAMVVRYMTYQYDPNSKTDLKKSIPFMITYPLLAVGFGWCVHRFM